ncbi:MAG: 2OG-Fe(II) oxygenase [Alphaproteobacteria bacterium]
MIRPRPAESTAARLSAATAPADLVNRLRYPLDRPESDAYGGLLHQSRVQLAQDQILSLSGFLRPAALTLLTEEARALAPRAHRFETMASPYSEDLSAADDTSLPASDPRRLRLRAAHGMVAGDFIGGDSAIRRLYQWPALANFLAHVLDLPILHRSADPMADVNLLVYRPGDENGWHFDTSEFVVSLLLTRADEGGEFEYVPMLRQPGDECRAEVAEVMQGARGRVRQVWQAPGTLILFRGKYSLHRVTPVTFGGPRLLLAFAFSATEGHMAPDGTRQALYGRTQPLT